MEDSFEVVKTGPLQHRACFLMQLLNDMRTQNNPLRSETTLTTTITE